MLYTSLIPATGQPFIELTETDSTNNYAMALAKNNEAQHGMAVFAHHQTAGKGQRGKAWHDTAGTNIALSVLLNTKDLPVSDGVKISMALALAAREFFTCYALHDVTIKWPNDIYWCDRKAAGILIENSIHGSNWQWAVAGIGVNVNQTMFAPALKNAVSLKQITGKQFDTVALAKQLASLVLTYFEQAKQLSAADLLGRYNNLLYKLGSQVMLRHAGKMFPCKITGVDEQGRLVVKDGPRPYFEFGEVEWVI